MNRCLAMLKGATTVALKHSMISTKFFASSFRCNLADQGWGEISQKKRWFHARRNHVEKTSAGRRLFFEMLGTNPNIVKTATWQQQKIMVQSLFESTLFLFSAKLSNDSVLRMFYDSKRCKKRSANLNLPWTQSGGARWLCRKGQRNVHVTN